MLFLHTAEKHGKLQVCLGLLHLHVQRVTSTYFYTGRQDLPA